MEMQRTIVVNDTVYMNNKYIRATRERSLGMKVKFLVTQHILTLLRPIFLVLT